MRITLVQVRATIILAGGKVHEIGQPEWPKVVIQLPKREKITCEYLTETEFRARFPHLIRCLRSPVGVNLGQQPVAIVVEAFPSLSDHTAVEASPCNRDG